MGGLFGAQTSQTPAAVGGMFGQPRAAAPAPGGLYGQPQAGITGFNR